MPWSNGLDGTTPLLSRTMIHAALLCPALHAHGLASTYLLTGTLRLRHI